MAQSQFQIALAAASASSLSRRRNRDSLAWRLENNDPALLHLQLCRKPASLFGDDFGQFLRALEANKTVATVELSWRFLSALSSPQRIQLMGQLGSLPALDKLMMEAIGPCDALVTALQKTQNLQTLWIGALRLASNTDVQKLTEALTRNTSLMHFNLNNIRLQKHGSYRVDDQGMVWFQENEASDGMVKLDLNPLLRAVANLPSMTKIQLELQLDPTKTARLEKVTLRSMFQPGITFLMLSSCNLDDEDVAVIAEELQSSESSLESLNLTRNTKITEIGWRLLAQMLQTNYSLTSLFTPETGLAIGPEPAYHRERFRSWSAARHAHLKVPTIPPSADCRKKMDLLLRLNERGRKQLLRDPSTSRLDWIDFLTQETDDIDASFYVLHAAPSLFVG